MQVAEQVAVAPSVPYADARLTVDVLTDGRSFFDLEAEWGAAVQQAGVAHPFLTHTWLRTWWECFGADAELHIIVVRRAGQITAIAPLLFERARMYGMPVRRLRLLQNDHVPRSGFIIAAEPELSYHAIWTTLFDTRHNWDVLQLSQLPSDAETLKTMTALATANGCATGLWQSGSSPYVAITGTEPEFFKGLSPKFRQNLRNRLTRLTKVGNAALEIVSTSAIQEGVDDVIRLEASGWKDEAGTAIAADSNVSHFYARLAERLADRGSLRLMFLNVDGRRVATSYSIEQDRRLFLCKTGYDPEFHTCSPFKLLMHFIVRYAYAQDLREIDLLGDAEPWKEEWTTAVRPHDWLFIFSNSHRARVLYPLKFQLVPAVKRTLVRNSEF